VWRVKKKAGSYFKTRDEILAFKSNTGKILPLDLIEYFTLVNGTNGEYNDRMFDFYPINNFKSIIHDLKYWRGIPDYGRIVNTLENCGDCYVFADYMLHLFAYAIRLFPHDTDINEVYAICGDQYRMIANSFSEFLDLYLEDSLKLEF
jgi:hypothetical protein